MPIKITRQTLEVLGTNLGQVTPAGIGTIYVPFLRNNWKASVEIDTLWETVISASGTSGKEERVSLKPRPSRVVTSTITGMDAGESAALQNSILTMMQGYGSDGRGGVPFPLYSDRTEATQNNYGASFIECDVSNRRFYRGQRVAFVPQTYQRRDYNGTLGTAFYGQIDEIFGNGISLVDPIDFDVLRADHIYPLIDIHPNLGFQTQLITDEHAQTRIRVIEKDGNNTLPPSWLEDVSYLFDYYNGYPIFDLTPNWKTQVVQGYDRLGIQYPNGRTSFTVPFGERPQVYFNITEMSLTRKEAWDLLRFFDSRRGRALPFWTIQPLTSWRPLAINNNYIDVPDHDYAQNVEDYFQYVGIEANEGLFVRSISSVTEFNGYFRIGFSDPFTSVPTPIRAAPAYLTRFNSDSHRQVWTTEAVSGARLEIKQILSEGSLAIPNL